jgi:hypothetical protein
MANRSLWKCCCSAFLIVCLSLFPGCIVDPASKKKADPAPSAKSSGGVDPLAQQARAMRANSTNESGTGLSDKSRAIENDLGLR